MSAAAHASTVALIPRLGPRCSPLIVMSYLRGVWMTLRPTLYRVCGRTKLRLSAIRCGAGAEQRGNPVSRLAELAMQLVEDRHDPVQPDGRAPFERSSRPVEPQPHRRVAVLLARDA